MAKKKAINKRHIVIRRKSKAERLDDLRVRLNRIYPNLPLGERSMPCVVLKIDGKLEPLSWRFCYTETKYKTKLSERILYWLEKMEFI